jgi:hypothetical protein
VVKGTLTRDFRPLFFSSKNSPRPLIHGLKPFWIWLRIRGENQLWNRRCNWHRCDKKRSLVNTKILHSIFVIFAQRCQWLRCACNSGVNDITVQVTVVSMTPLCMSQQCQWLCCAACSRVRFPYKKQCVELFAKILKKSWLHSSVNDTARLSYQIRSHIRKGFNLCIRGPFLSFD